MRTVKEVSSARKKAQRTYEILREAKNAFFGGIGSIRLNQYRYRRAEKDHDIALKNLEDAKALYKSV